MVNYEEKGGNGYNIFHDRGYSRVERSMRATRGLWGVGTVLVLVPSDGYKDDYL